MCLSIYLSVAVSPYYPSIYLLTSQRIHSSAALTVTQPLEQVITPLCPGPRCTTRAVAPSSSLSIVIRCKKPCVCVCTSPSRRGSQADVALDTLAFLHVLASLDSHYGDWQRSLFVGLTLSLLYGSREREREKVRSLSLFDPL